MRLINGLPSGSGCSGGVAQQRDGDKGRMFFFEKKNQKTFIALSWTRRQRAQTRQSFLVLFFKKELLLSHFLR